MGICVSCRRRELQPPDKRAGGAGGGRVPGKGAAAELLPRRAAPDMANSISNIKMTNPIKGIVSKRRKRYIKDGFNLDLAYITDRLIAMGFPAEKLEGVYRNHIDEVYRFLEQMHMDHYKIYNLCSEKCYDSSRFHGRVARYAFEDHTPPNMELIQPFCEDVHLWLSADSRNVAAVHCKAGKGRTGTMVCCYLLFSGQKPNADEALKYYGKKRTHDEKGVTIPSQRRYVEYYEALVRSGLKYSATRVHIRELVMCPPPALNGGQGSIEITVSQVSPPLKTPSGCHEVRKHDSHIRIVLDQCTPLQGDVRVDVYNKPKMMRKEKLFHFWFNTFFVANGIAAVRVAPPQDSLNLDTFKFTLNKWELDDAHKDKQHKQYSPDFKVEVVVQKQPESARYLGGGGGGGPGGRPPAPPSPPSPPSSASSSSDPDADSDAHWDSGETPYSALSAATHTWDSTPEGEHPQHNWTTPANPPISWTGPEVLPNWAPELPPKPWTNPDNGQQNWSSHIPFQNWRHTPESPEAWVTDNAPFFDRNKEENCPHGFKFFSPAYSSQDACEHRCMRLDAGAEGQFDTNTSCSYLNDVEMKPCTNCIEMDFSNDNGKNSTPIKTMENAGMIKDGYLLIDRSPRHQKDMISDPNKSDDMKCKAESSTRKCRHVGISKDGYMLVDATPRQPPAPVKDPKGKAGASSTEVLGLSAVPNMTNMRLNSERPADDYMEFSAADGYMKAAERDTKPRASFSEEYAYMSELSDKTGLCEASVGDIVAADKPAEATDADAKPGKNKKHSFFKRDEYKNDKGKIPKVSSDHTISDESKKKYNFFQRRDEDGSKPRINFGDMKASWREFSGKWSDNRKKKDRDES